MIVCLFVGWLVAWLVGWLVQEQSLNDETSSGRAPTFKRKLMLIDFIKKANDSAKQLKTKSSSAVPSLKSYSSPTETRHSENSWSIPINFQVLKCQGIWDLLATPTHFPRVKQKSGGWKRHQLRHLWNSPSTTSNEHQQHQMSMVDPLEGNIYLVDSWRQLVYLYMHVYIYIYIYLLLLTIISGVFLGENCCYQLAMKL